MPGTLVWGQVDGDWRLVPPEDATLEAYADRLALALDWLPAESAWEPSLWIELAHLREWLS